MVARGASAAGPVLLACCQWDPLGLARRLPSLGAGAWRSAPLLPWRVQCPVRVCAALAAGSGGSGRYLVLCLSRFPLPAPRVPRRVWQGVLAGCPLPLLDGTPFHVVCAFCELGPVALLVVPACPLCVCALALPRRPLPPPLGGVVCAPREVSALGAIGAVPRGPFPSACPAPVPCSVWHVGGGGGPGPVPPYLAWGCAPPLGRVRGVCPVAAACRGGGGGPSLGGVACHRCEGRRVSGAVPPPAARPLKWAHAGHLGMELAPAPDRARGTHRPRGMAYQRARVRDTRTGRPATSSAGHAGREGGNGRDTTPGTGPSPPNRPRAPRTHRRGTAPAKAVGAHCATPQPLGYAASAPAQGGPTGDKPVARAQQRRRPGRPRIRGAMQWVSTRSHGCKLMH